MRLTLDGKISKTYVQTLCMMFFHGEKFPENEENPKGTISVTAVDTELGINAKCTFTYGEKSASSCDFAPFEDGDSYERTSKCAVGRAVYKAGKELTGKDIPWGILTGVRPAKVAGALLSSGRGILKTKKVLRDEYLLNPQKASLATTVANAERKITKKVPENSCSLYISIPFCPTRCAYCSFVSYTTPRLLSMIDEYLDALIVDLEETFATIEKLGMGISTIYIGGGTPTTLSAEQLDILLGVVSKHVDTSTLAEFTLEAGRPDTITAEKLSVAKKYGVTRVSVNPQTLNDDILRDIGRRHTTEDFYKAYEIAKNSGIRDINIDLIAGLPGDDFENFSETVDAIIDLAPTNITVHTFCVKKASDALRKNSDVYSLSGGDAAKCVSYSQLKTKFAGYKPYYMYRQKNTVGNLENVGFSIDGHEGLYNIYMMEEIQTIFAVGAGAVTKLVKHKPKNDKETETIIKRFFKPKYPYEYLRDATDTSEETKNKKEAKIREIMDFFSEN
jgi:oxygen-independent coproporphyrinogen-3 oxidase